MTETLPAQTTSFSPEIADNLAWRNAVRQADDWARATLGRWAAAKDFQWRAAPGDRRGVFDLRIVDGDNSVSCRFDLFEVGNEKLVKQVVFDAWSQLVKQAIRSELQGLREFGERLRKEATVGGEN